MLRSAHAQTPLGTWVSVYHPTHTLSLSTVNPTWGRVLLNPEPNDPNLPAFPIGTVLTLTATPIEGKRFKQGEIDDPCHPGDANYVTIDANNPITIAMTANRQVTAIFACGSGAEQALPLLVIGVCVLSLSHRRRGL